MAHEVAINVRHGDIFETPADVLILKYAQSLHGVDAAAVDKLGSSADQLSFPRPGDWLLVDAPLGMHVVTLLFVGVPRLRDLGYREIRKLARTAMKAVSAEQPNATRLAITVHGPGYGLDEVEAFQALVAGLLDGIQGHPELTTLESIYIVERNKGRADRLASHLKNLLPDGISSSASELSTEGGDAASEAIRSAGYSSEAKPHVFVAMPFKSELDDTYHYGIESAVRRSGFVCERADLCSFTGDVLEWVRSRVRTSTLVIADLTDANPNVYLEVGYAWGCGVPTVLIVKDASHLKFDVRGQRCVVYSSIRQLEGLLSRELGELRRSDV